MTTKKLTPSQAERFKVVYPHQPVRDTAEQFFITEREARNLATAFKLKRNNRIVFFEGMVFYFTAGNVRYCVSFIADPSIRPYRAIKGSYAVSVYGSDRVKDYVFNGSPSVTIAFSFFRKFLS